MRLEVPGMGFIAIIQSTPYSNAWEIRGVLDFRCLLIWEYLPYVNEISYAGTCVYS